MTEANKRHDRPWSRAILHVDMDAFYASIEQRDRPELAGAPVIVGGGGRRGVVSAASYEARRYGVKSAMPMFAALKLCPQAKTVAPRIAHYTSVSRHVMAIFQRFSPLVEPLSLDEAFLDVTGTERLFGSPVDAAWQVQRAVRTELQLTCSVGVAASKYVAKVASDLKKPNGIVVVPPGEERSFLEPLPIERLWGVGPKTSERLHALGFVTIGDIARAPAADLVRDLGALGEHITRLARGDDERPVDIERENKSIGAERTLEHDIRGQEAVLRELDGLIDEVAATLRARGVRASGVRLKLKYADFRRVSREVQLPEPACERATLRGAIDLLIKRVDVERPMRLVGLAATGLVDDDAPRQASLFGESTERAETLGKTLDAINARFGDATVARGGQRPRNR